MFDSVSIFGAFAKTDVVELSRTNHQKSDKTYFSDIQQPIDATSNNNREKTSNILPFLRFDKSKEENNSIISPEFSLESIISPVMNSNNYARTSINSSSVGNFKSLLFEYELKNTTNSNSLFQSSSYSSALDLGDLKVNSIEIRTHRLFLGLSISWRFLCFHWSRV